MSSGPAAALVARPVELPRPTENLSNKRTVASQVAVTKPRPQRCLHRSARLLLWCSFVAFHCIGVAFFAFTAHCYRVLPNTGLDRWLEFFSLGMGSSYYSTIAAVHAIVAVLHAASILQMVMLSIKKRRLVFSGGSRRRRARGKKVTGWRSIASGIRHGGTTIYTALFTQSGYLGVQGPCFELVLLSREIVETSLQTFQAYRMSRLLPRSWLNRFYVTLLVFNCWSTVIVHQIFHHSHLKRYFAALLCDFLLDWVSAIVVPSILVYIYSKDQDSSTDDFFGVKWFESVWLINASNEFQMILVVSWSDLATRMVFALGMLSNIITVKRLVTIVLPSQPHPTSGNRTLRAIAPVPAENPTDSERRTDSLIVRTNLLVKNGRIFSKVLRMLFFLWGLAVLVLHVMAELNPKLPQCKMQVRPWGVAEPSCSLVLLNCYEEQISGASDEIASRLAVLYHPSVVMIMIHHCPSLEMPPIVKQLGNLQNLKMYNTTIAKWDSESALTQSSHPHLGGVMLLRVTTANGEIPQGLLSSNFPQSLRYMGFVVSNIKKLPDDLHLKWPPFCTIHFDTAQFSDFPPVLLSISPTILILNGTPLTSVPKELFEVPSLYFLYLGGTAISALPENVTNPSTALASMSLEGTNISYFPAWIDQWLARKAYTPFVLPIAAGHSPYCAERQEIFDGPRTTFSSAATISTPLSTLMNASEANWPLLTSTVTCESSAIYLYPLYLEDIFSALQ